MESDLPPPWIKYPHIARFDIGWRMGMGENYYNAFYKWFSGISSDERKNYVDRFPEPPQWMGFYNNIEKHPWA